MVIIRKDFCLFCLNIVIYLNNVLKWSNYYYLYYIHLIVTLNVVFPDFKTILLEICIDLDARSLKLLLNYHIPFVLDLSGVPSYKYHFFSNLNLNKEIFTCTVTLRCYHHNKQLLDHDPFLF